jgi:SAM-dependent methyltransferase
MGRVVGDDRLATSFGSIAEDYDRLRAAPPPPAVRWLLPRDCDSAVDLGAGTGLLTRALDGAVAHVIAVEPDARMRSVLIARSPGVRALDGRGEAIPLPDAGQDAVLVSSAWHWMDPDRAVPEVARVLRDHGRFGLVWTSRDREVDWIRELDRLRIAAPVQPSADAGIEGRRRGITRVVLADDAPFNHVETASFAFTTTMTIDDLVDALATHSRVILADPAVRAAGLERARHALRTWFPNRDSIAVPMRAECWRADRIARQGTLGLATIRG